MGTLEYAVLFSSLLIWAICLCVRVPKKILGMQSSFSFFFVWLGSLSASFPEEQEHSVQGPGGCKPRQKKLFTISYSEMNVLNLLLVWEVPSGIAGSVTTAALQAARSSKMLKHHIVVPRNP